MYEEELKIAVNAARAAGQIAIALFGRVDNIIKKGEIDLVTEADIRAQKEIIDIIREAFPSDHILAEEGAEKNLPSIKGGSLIKQRGRLWLVDPLDGTTNFAHGFPFFAPSIALEDQGRLMVGVVYIPYMNELFHAVRGKGAYLNNRPLAVSKIDKMEEALVATGFPYDIHKRYRSVLDLFQRMITVAQGVRRPGSAAIDLCYVAAGRFDAFWEEALKPWDTAAGALIVEEAGGKVTTYEGGPYDPYKSTIVASNSVLHPIMLEIINKAHTP